ncbi:coniferyl aldehyde dehydrogenase [Sulfuritalea sp.]|uniref:coniferyl aldehyde dehydrogenase n=1 Tax=Sulfuritalea sp. TaxID=2480090 RepID=UPI001ACF2964|nr:coniferyl aldehyde dehydrogenase [Sulfuritalea sp.]MBN8475817.1 coniferyl aldehyde dehydrogenase [Sulfuritalea sp.]
MNAMEPANPGANAPVADPPAFKSTFAAMHAATRRNPSADRDRRLTRLNALLALVHDNGERFVEAIAADFGHRSAHETRLLEVFPSLEALRHTRSHFGAWMKPQKKPASIWFRPGRARIISQPLGVVGIIVPWNYPLFLAISPMAAALAAGNRAMVKMSEFTPHTGELLAELVAKHFAAEDVAVVLGDAAVGADFARLPFDHLLFTGSTKVGHDIMRMAADNLTPVTLELGGKSPAIVGADYPLAKAAERIMVGKLLNAGQTCIAPDYVLVPAGREQAFIEAARAAVAKCWPDMANSPDYTAIVNERHYQRLQGYVADAQQRGATVEPLSTAQADAARRRLPPLALLQVDDGMRVMQDEIFGPLLPVLPYHDLDAAIFHVNQHPRPLALYYFGNDSEQRDRVLSGTVAGGVTINDTILHIAQEELPFGGVGPSGMGHYHGSEGFKTFSKQKSVFYQSGLNGMSLFNPPYGALFERLTKFLIR